MNTLSEQPKQPTSFLSNDERWRFCVAPMIDLTDRHCRYFFRTLSQHARLYTEMVTCPAVVHGDKDYLLGFSPQEQPLALQLGGCKPDEYRYCAEHAQGYGYQEININVGCPSNRVQSGSFGACLMKEPELVAECFRALSEECSLPITVKCRIGIDDLDSFEFFEHFVATLAQSGCTTFIVHARVAILQGLSPKENRNIPPLNYERVQRLKEKYPELTIVLNGGINSLKQCEEQLKVFDGVMLGREIYKNPYLLTQVDHLLFHKAEYSAPLRSDIFKNNLPYLRDQMKQGVSGISMLRHFVGLYHGQHLGRQWRNFISTHRFKTEQELTQLYELAQKIDEQNLAYIENSLYA